MKLSIGLLAALLILASILLISNTIRLSLMARRREVAVMKLVGATDWFIRWPFVLEGIFVGAMGGLMAIMMLLVAKVAFIDPLKDDFSLIASPGHDQLRPARHGPAGREHRGLGRGLRACRCAASFACSCHTRAG